LSAFGQRTTLMLSAVIFVAAVLSKFVGCGLGAVRLGRADVVRIGVGTVSRGRA